MAPVQSEAGAKTQPASRRLTAVAGYPAVSFQVHTCAACMQGQQRRCFTAPLSVVGKATMKKRLCKKRLHVHQGKHRSEPAWCCSDLQAEGGGVRAPREGRAEGPRLPHAALCGTTS